MCQGRCQELGVPRSMFVSLLLVVPSAVTVWVPMSCHCLLRFGALFDNNRIRLLENCSGDPFLKTSTNPKAGLINRMIFK